MKGRFRRVKVLGVRVSLGLRVWDVGFGLRLRAPALAQKVPACNRAGAGLSAGLRV